MSEEEEVEVASDDHVEVGEAPFPDDQEPIAEEEKSLDEMTPDELREALAAEKARNEQLALENKIEADAKRRIEQGGVGDPNDPFSAVNNPMLQRAETLPEFIKGADGSASHVQNADSDYEEPEALDESLGGGIGDPSTFTG